MTAPLSPAAQAVLDAAGASEPGIHATIAATLRATANAIGLLPVDAVALTIEDMTEQRIRRDLLALATELEAQ
jgi:hypothetical protein